jgi:hypothetical protein
MTASRQFPAGQIEVIDSKVLSLAQGILVG